MPKDLVWLRIFPVYDSVHAQLKLIAAEQQTSLIHLVDQIFKEWLDREGEEEDERKNLVGHSPV